MSRALPPIHISMRDEGLLAKDQGLIVSVIVAGQISDEQVRGLLADDESRVRGVGSYVLRRDAQVGNLEPLEAMHAELAIDNALLGRGRHLGRAHRVPRGADRLPHPLLEDGVVRFGVDDVLDVLGQRRVVALALGLGAGGEGRVARGVLAPVDGHAAQDLALLLVRPHGRLDVDALRVREEARLEVQRRVERLARDVDGAARVGVHGES